MNNIRFRNSLIRDEGLHLHPYVCPAGFLSIGVGRNLDTVGITSAEAMYLLENDIDRIQKQAQAKLPWFQNLDEARQEVILNMIFNMGISKFFEFQKMITAVRSGLYDQAAQEMLQSKWATQVGRRATELAEMMKKGGM